MGLDNGRSKHYNLKVRTLLVYTNQSYLTKVSKNLSYLNYLSYWKIWNNFDWLISGRWGECMSQEQERES